MSKETIVAKRPVFVLLAGIAGLVIGYVAPSLRLAKRSVLATGECAAKIPRDMFAITLNVKAVNKNGAESLRIAQNAADDIVRRIRAFDDKTIEIQTKSMFSHEKVNWNNNTSTVVGIETEISLEITSANKESINAAVGGAVQVKNADVMPQDLRNFSSAAVIKDATAKCLQAAISDARNKAAAIASGDGEKIGRLISAEYGAQNARDLRPMTFKSLAESANYIQSADGDLVISVNASFEIR
jgi:uncharacterized protein YggE